MSGGTPARAFFYSVHSAHAGVPLERVICTGPVTSSAIASGDVRAQSLSHCGSSVTSGQVFVPNRIQAVGPSI